VHSCSGCASPISLLTNPSVREVAGFDEPSEFRAHLRWKVAIGMRIDDGFLFGVVLLQLARPTERKTAIDGFVGTTGSGSGAVSGS
jgi:hypothetical protein